MLAKEEKCMFFRSICMVGVKGKSKDLIGLNKSTTFSRYRVRVGLFLPYVRMNRRV
jgi:hypothetical protein